MEGGMEMYSLECSCTFHQQCLKNFVDASGGTMESLAAMRCPNCRKDAIEMRESAAAAALAAGELGDLSAGSSSGGGLSAQSDPVSPITVDDVSASREITGDLAIADTEVAEDDVTGDMEDAHENLGNEETAEPAAATPRAPADEAVPSRTAPPTDAAAEGPQPADSAPADDPAHAVLSRPKFPESDMSCGWCGTKAKKLRCVSKGKCSFK